MKNIIIYLISLLLIEIYSKLEKNQFKSFLNNIKNEDKIINKTVIGIYGNSNPENDTSQNGSYYAQTYVMWLNEFGAEVMAIHHWYTEEELDVILNKVSGVLFMGGGRDFIDGGVWEEKALKILDYAEKNSLPVWGTCQGFQLIGTLLSKDFKLLKEEFNNINKLESVTLTDKGRSGSKMYNLFNDNDFKNLTEEESTIYYHAWAFHSHEFENNSNLIEKVYVTGYGFDSDNKKFVNSYEGINNSYILATQYHPEKVPFKRFGYKLPHNTNALKISQLLGIQFIEYSRKHQKEKDKHFYEKDRETYDFFYPYKIQPRANYVYKEETYYFKKK